MGAPIALAYLLNNNRVSSIKVHSRFIHCDLYFFASFSSSFFAFALFSLLPTRRASLLAVLRTLYASSVDSKSATLASSTVLTFLMGKALEICLAVPEEAPLTSSAEASPFFCLPALRGNKMRRDVYSLRRATFAARDSSERFWRRGSTEMPMVRASLRGTAAAWNYSQKSCE